MDELIAQRVLDTIYKQFCYIQSVCDDGYVATRGNDYSDHYGNNAVKSDGSVITCDIRRGNTNHDSGNAKLRSIKNGECTQTFTVQYANNNRDNDSANIWSVESGERTQTFTSFSLPVVQLLTDFQNIANNTLRGGS